ncbi:microtubule-associated protein Jupiter isoform X1 [Musca domestica]|uniref:Microtubule-associated protein Jupiter n=1 Tax=Musca domestica TaxID=7370 RepID=A0ABM3UKY8_MUSDO|nr:microtubule-associated protein Jupiter isoform X1 [Musca domestica]
MAAYAAFKHVELYNVGKTKKRVLRPPGGGTSDIFGGDLPQTPRNVKNHMQSNIFSCEKDSIKNNVRQGAHRFYFIGDQPRRAQKNVDSYQRLFGEPERVVTPAKNHMRSNIPFGANNEAAQTLITNGNGHHYNNGKSSSVSSASSSVSSSTENLKMNGYSKTVYHRKMSKTETDYQCPSSSPSSTLSEQSPQHRNPEAYESPIPNCNEPNSQEFQNATPPPCSQSSSIATNLGSQSLASQTHTSTASNSDNPISLSTKFQNSLSNDATRNYQRGSISECVDMSTASKATAGSRNPLIGLGLCGDGVGGWKPIKPKTRRDGNPVTGEGYTKNNDFSNHTPSLNGANQVINKNRIPPGGFSSGLW